MKIAFCLFKYFPFGGLQRDMLATAKICHESGHEIHIYCMKWRGKKPDWMSINEINISDVSNHSRAKAFSKKVGKLLDKASFDCVIGFNRMENLNIYFASDECFAAQKKNRPWWRQFTSRVRTYKKLERAVFSPRSKTSILCLTEQQKNAYQDYYHTQDERLIVLPPNLPFQKTHEKDDHISKQLRTSLGIKADDFMLLSIASNFNTKGVDRSILAFGSLEASQQQHCHLVIIGPGNIDDMKKLCKKQKINTAHIHFVGSQHDINPYLAAAHIFLHPARHEAGGIVLLEAIKAHIPIITTLVCGYSSIVKTAQAGKVLPLDFSQAQYNKSLRKFLNHTVLEQYAQNAGQYADRLIPGQAITQTVRAIEEY